MRRPLAPPYINPETDLPPLLVKIPKKRFQLATTAPGVLIRPAFLPALPALASRVPSCAYIPG